MAEAQSDVRPLSEERIRGRLDAGARQQIESFDLYLNTDSTNERLLDMPPPAAGKIRVCIAEYQASGRGRMGRHWLCPPASGVCLSVSRVFETPGGDFSALGLAAGVAIIEALGQCGAPGAMLKWPNDILWHGRKLAGVLIETRGEADDSVKAVIGVGINYALDRATRRAIGKSATFMPADMLEICAARPPGRNMLAAALIQRLLHMLSEFEHEGFMPFIGQWREADALLNRPVTVSDGSRQVAGVARGIDEAGALLVEVDGVQSRFISGEASLSGVAEAGRQ